MNGDQHDRELKDMVLNARRKHKEKIRDSKISGDKNKKLSNYGITKKNYHKVEL